MALNLHSPESPRFVSHVCLCYILHNFFSLNKVTFVAMQMVSQCHGCQLNVNRQKLFFFLKVYSFKYPGIYCAETSERLSRRSRSLQIDDFISVLQDCLYQL